MAPMGRQQGLFKTQLFTLKEGLNHWAVIWSIYPSPSKARVSSLDRGPECLLCVCVYLLTSFF